MAIGAVAKQLAGRFMGRGGKDIVLGSIPGAVATTAMSTVTTGNPLAGLAVGATDLVSSSLLARGLGSRALQNQLMKLEAAKIPLAGKIAQALPGKMMNGQYMMSMPQQIATSVGSVGSAIALEPHFYPQQVNQPPAHVDEITQKELLNQQINQMAMLPMSMGGLM